MLFVMNIVVVDNTKADVNGKQQRKHASTILVGKVWRSQLQLMVYLVAFFF